MNNESQYVTLCTTILLSFLFFSLNLRKDIKGKKEGMSTKDVIHLWKKLTFKANTINLDKKECIVEKIATEYQVKQVVKRVVK